MTQLMPDTLGDFVNLTLSKFERDKWVDISRNYQDYLCASRLFTGKKMKSMGGQSYVWKLQVSNTGTARPSQLFDTDQTAVMDLSIEAKVPYAMQTVNWSYDTNEEAFQTSMEEIVDVISMRRHSAYTDWFELMEGYLWGAPSSSTQSPRIPSGIPFWLQKSATEGFNGGNPSGFSSGAAEVDTSTYANWKNYTFGYAGVTREDLIAKMKKACMFTNFKTPHKFNELGAGQKFELFTTYSVIEKLELVVESRNDNLGNDIGKVDGGDITFKRAPIIWVPYLETNDTTNPIYGLNWDTFFPVTKKGASGKQGLEWHKPMQAPNQRNVRNVHGDSWCQYICNNRRGNFVAYDTTA